MSSLPKIKISLDATGRGNVEINGHRLPGVTGVNLHASGDGTDVQIRLIGDVEIDAEANPVIRITGAPKK